MLRTTWDVVCFFTKQSWIVQTSLLPCLGVRQEEVTVCTSPRESRWAGLRVTQFTSSSQDTLKQLALRELLCNYQQQQQGNWTGGQTLCHSTGEQCKPIPVSKIYNEMYLNWPFWQTKTRVSFLICRGRIFEGLLKILKMKNTWWTVSVVSWFHWAATSLKLISVITLN